jgi:hypothetical protein
VPGTIAAPPGTCTSAVHVHVAWCSCCVLTVCTHRHADTSAQVLPALTACQHCPPHPHPRRYTSPAKLAIEGRSAGGLLMGAVLNMRPDLFNAAIMGVPFVDALTTMLDDTIPLTIIEWEEWGNPADPEYYHYMKSYAPVDNVQRAAYPHVLVTAGLHDPRVGYWEPVGGTT